MRRATVIECLRAGHSPNKTVRFFDYPTSTVYDIAQKPRRCTSRILPGNPAGKIHAREKTVRIPEVVQRTQKFILEDLGARDYP